MHPPKNAHMHLPTYVTSGIACKNQHTVVEAPPPTHLPVAPARSPGSARVQAAYLVSTGSGKWLRRPPFLRERAMRATVIAAFVRETDEQIETMIKDVFLPTLFSTAYLDGRAADGPLTRREVRRWGLQAAGYRVRSHT